MADNNGRFLRRSSGLVKAATISDVFIFNTGLISIGIGVLYTHLSVPSNYPGGSLPLGSLFATLAMLAVGAGMWAWSVTIPRSGAVYVYLSRGVSPALGFSLGAVDACCWLFYNAVAAVLFSTAGIAPFFVSLHIQHGNDAYLKWAQFLETPSVSALVGTVLIVLCGLALVVGMRRFFFLQRGMFIVAIVGTAVMLFALMTANMQSLDAGLAAFYPNYESPSRHLIASAKEAGLETVDFSLLQTLRLSVWPFLPLIGGAFSISIAGEIRDVRRGQRIGILGSIAVCGVLFAVIAAAANASLGVEFQAAVTYLDAIGHEDALPFTPYFSTILALTSKSTLQMGLICLGFLAWIYFWIPGMLAYSERVMLAMSLDRVGPEFLGEVNERYHTPHFAILVSVVVSVVLTWLYACTEFFNTLIFILAATIAWGATATVGIVFPWLRPRLWEASPLAQWSILGLPSLSVLSVLSAASLGTMTVLLWRDPIAAGHEPKSLITIAVVFFGSTSIFYLIRFRRKRSGTDVDLAFKEIPVE